VTVGDLAGELFESPDGGPCMVAWADEDAAIFFHLSSTVPDSTALLRMAESVTGNN